MNEHFFEELLAILCASLAVTVIARRLGLPNIVAYIVAGSVVGPHVLGLVEQPDNYTFLAHFGLVFLLFSLGLEFSLPKLIALRSSVFGLGGIQVLFCTLMFGGAVWLWGSSAEASIIIAGALALSSTAIVTRELSSLGQVHSRAGQLSIGILLFQDLAAVIFLILVPVLAASDSSSLWSSLGWALVRGGLLMLILLSVGKWLLPLLHKEIALARSDEIFLLSTLVIVLLAAWVTHSFHLSMSLGGFVIGMMLGESPFRHQLNSDIRSFKDIFLGLFFVTIGMSIQVDLLLDYLPRVLLFAAALIIIKALLIVLLVTLFGDRKITALQSGINLAQAGEFGLALLTLGVLEGVLPNDQASFIMLVAIFSMLASPLLIRHGDRVSHYLSALFSWKDNAGPPLQTRALHTDREHVIVGGFGRVGRTIARLLDANEISYVVIDSDSEVVREAQELNRNVIYGDCTNIDILRSCHIENARMAILTFRSLDIARRALEHIRASGIRVPIIVRCYDNRHFEELVSLGADYVVPEMLEASLVVGSQVLNLLGIAENDIETQISNERERQLQRDSKARGSQASG